MTREEMVAMRKRCGMLPGFFEQNPLWAQLFFAFILFAAAILTPFLWLSFG